MLGCQKSEIIYVDSPKPISPRNMVGIIERMCFAYNYNLTNNTVHTMGPLHYLKSYNGAVITLDIMIEQNSPSLYIISIEFKGPHTAIAELDQIIYDIKDAVDLGNWLNH